MTSVRVVRIGSPCLLKLIMVWCLLYKIVNEGGKKGDRESEAEKPSQHRKWKGLWCLKDSQPLLILPCALNSVDNTDYLDEHLAYT